MEIRHLRYFVAMAESESLMKASERLNVAQPALSVHLTNLEVELGVQLMARSNRGVELTEEGKLLYERATTILRYHQEAISALTERKNQPHGSVSLGVPSSCPPALIAELYRMVRERAPGVDFYITEASSAALYEWLQAGRLDFALLFSLPGNSGLDSAPLFMEDYVLISAPEHDDGSTEIEFKNVFDLPLITSCKSTPWRKILDEMAAKHGKILTATLESDSAKIMRAIVRAGQAHAIIPEICIQEDVADGNLWARRIVNPSLRGTLSVCSSSSKQLGQAQRVIREIIIEAGRSVTSVSSEPQNADGFEPLMGALPTRLFPERRYKL